MSSRTDSLASDDGDVEDAASTLGATSSITTLSALAAARVSAAKAEPPADGRFAEACICTSISHCTIP